MRRCLVYTKLIKIRIYHVAQGCGMGWQWVGLELELELDLELKLLPGMVSSQCCNLNARAQIISQKIQIWLNAFASANLCNQMGIFQGRTTATHTYTCVYLQLHLNLCVCCVCCCNADRAGHLGASGYCPKQRVLHFRFTFCCFTFWPGS